MSRSECLYSAVFFIGVVSLKLSVCWFIEPCLVETTGCYFLMWALFGNWIFLRSDLIIGASSFFSSTLAGSSTALVVSYLEGSVDAIGASSLFSSTGASTGFVSSTFGASIAVSASNFSSVLGASSTFLASSTGFESSGASFFFSSTAATSTLSSSLTCSSFFSSAIGADSVGA